MEKTTVTSNGVNIYYFDSPHIHSFTISLFIRSGLIYENKNNFGFTHLFEHAAFRNVNAHLNGCLYETLDLCGLDFNASTYVDYTEFTITGAPKHFRTATDIISKVLSPFIISSKDLELEKKRIKAEIHEECEGSLRRFSDSVIYAGSPLSLPITGKCRDIDKLGITKLKKLSDSMMHPENLFFYVAGSFTETDISYLSGKVSAFHLNGRKTEQKSIILPSSFGNRKCTCVIKNSPSASVRFSFDIDMRGLKEKELIMLSDIIFTGETCPVYREISENAGLIYSYENYIDFHGSFAVLSVSFDIRADKLNSAAAMLFAILADLKKSAGSRIRYVLPIYCDNALMCLDDSVSLASDNGYYNHILNLGFYSPELKSREFLSVSADKLCDICNKIFRTGNLVICIKGSRNAVSPNRIRQSALKILGN